MINRGYVPNHKFWDQIGRNTPVVEYSESIRPHIELTPAAWLPVARYDRETESYFVISTGKVVAEDTEGKAVPAGLRKKWNALIGSASAALVYSVTDAAENVVDLTTGELLAGAASYTEAQITAALQERGLIRPGERAMDIISKPIGIASYNYNKASGPDHFNPATLYQHNFRPQATVAITCDYVAAYPVLPALIASETMDGSIGSAIDWSATRTGGWFNATAINGLVKYSNEVSVGDDVVAYVFEKWPLAHITQESPITASVAGLVKRVGSVSAIAAAGDFFIDYDLGMLFVYEADGDAIPSPWSTSATIKYYHYNDEGTATNTVTTYACATGNLEYGDILTYDENSNLVKAVLDIGTAEGYDGSGKYDADPDYGGGTDAAISAQVEAAVKGYVEGIVGQVIGVMQYPKDYLDRVKTAYEGQTAASMRTPGSATGGRTDQLTYANAAEKMIAVNLILR